MTEEKKQETVKAVNALCEAFGIVKPLDILKCSKMLTDLYAELEEENKNLSKRILQLQKTNGDITDRIEKMKCCENCKFKENGMNYELGEPCYMCKAFSNWKLSE